MIKKDSCRSDKKLFLIYLAVFAVFAALIYIVPYSHDDWAWGCKVGIERLESNFADYNGRYMGNYFVLAMTRSKLLQVVVTALSATLMCYLPTKYYGKSSGLFAVFSAMMIFLMPREIFVQTLVWTSGYSNYAPPILLTVIYFILIRNIFEDEKPEYSKLTPLAAVVLGVLGALFMEHVTLYNLAISCLIVLFVLIRHKKICLTHVAFAVGCAVGTVIMFSNSSYGLIASANDAQGGYRSTALSNGLVKTLTANLKVIGEQLFIKNVALWVIISILLALLTAAFIRKNSGKFKNAISLTSLFVNVTSLFILFAKSKNTDWTVVVGTDKSQLITLLFMTAVMAVYCLSALTLVCLCVTDKSIMLKMALMLVSVVVVTVPLLVVSPVSARCFFPQYFLLMIFCVLLLGYIQKQLNFNQSTNKALAASFTATATAMCIFMFSIYLPINYYAEKRIEYAHRQIDNGETTVYICDLPNTAYMHVGTPKQKMWTDRFKMFYGLDENVEIKVMNYNEFDKWAAEYDSSANK